MKTKHILAFMLMAMALMACSNQKEEQTPARFNLATYNLRLYNSGDSMVGDGWEARFPALASLVRYHEFDIFGTRKATATSSTTSKTPCPASNISVSAVKTAKKAANTRPSSTTPANSTSSSTATSG